MVLIFTFQFLTTLFKNVVLCTSIALNFTKITNQEEIWYAVIRSLVRTIFGMLRTISSQVAKKWCYIEAATWLAASIKLRADWSTAAGVKYRNDMMFIRIHHILSVLFNFIQPQSPTCHKHSTEKIQLRMQVQSSVESGYCGVFSPGLQILSQFKAPVLKMGHLPLRVSIRQLS